MGWRTAENGSNDPIYAPSKTDWFEMCEPAGGMLVAPP
jgi:hypothetical protein